MNRIAVIVENTDVEKEYLILLEENGFKWINGGEKPTKWIPSKVHTLPYYLVSPMGESKPKLIACGYGTDVNNRDDYKHVTIDEYIEELSK